MSLEQRIRQARGELASTRDVYVNAQDRMAKVEDQMETGAVISAYEHAIQLIDKALEKK